MSDIGDDWAVVQEMAAVLVREHGERATAVAKHNALKARAQGDAAQAEVWDVVADIAACTLTSDQEV